MKMKWCYLLLTSQEQLPKFLVFVVYVDDNSELKRAQKFEFTESIYCVEELLEKSDTKLFGRLTNPAHCLHPILPSYNKSHEFLLRKRGHTFILPIVPITCIKTLFFPVVFLGSYNFCDVVFYIICHDVLN